MPRANEWSGDYEKTFNDFWKEIVCNADGSLNINNVKQELHDYLQVMNQVCIVYDHVTGGRISKQNTMAFEVTAEADRNYEELYAEEN